MWLGDISTDVSPTDPGNTGSSGNWFTDIAQGFAQFKLAQQQLKTSDAVTQLQLQRARAGLPLLDIDPSQLGVPSVRVGLSSDTQHLAEYAVFGVLGLLAFNSLLKKFV